MEFGRLYLLVRAVLVDEEAGRFGETSTAIVDPASRTQQRTLRRSVFFVVHLHRECGRIDSSRSSEGRGNVGVSHHGRRRFSMQVRWRLRRASSRTSVFNSWKERIARRPINDVFVVHNVLVHLRPRERHACKESIKNRRPGWKNGGVLSVIQYRTSCQRRSDADTRAS